MNLAQRNAPLLEKEAARFALRVLAQFAQRDSVRLSRRAKATLQFDARRYFIYIQTMKIAIWQRTILYGVGLLVGFWLLGMFIDLFRFSLLLWVPRLAFIFWALLLAINISFALGVMRDAESQSASGRKTFFVDTPIWGLTVLVGGLFAVIVYWIFHHSTLRRN